MIDGLYFPTLPLISLIMFSIKAKVYPVVISYPYVLDVLTFYTIPKLKTLMFMLMGVLNWLKGHDSQGVGRTSGSGGISDSFHSQPEQAGLQNMSDRSRSTFGLPTAVSSLGSLQPPVRLP